MFFRKPGNRKLITRIFIYGDGLTEFYYSKHIHNLKYRNLKIEIKRTNFEKSQNTEKLKRKIKDLLDIEGFAIFIFDIENNNNRKEKILRKFKKLIKEEKLIPIYSNPSIEYWFLLHHEDTNRFFNAVELKNYLKKYISNYSTDENFLKNEKWVKDLLDKLEYAVKNSKKYTDGTNSYTNFYNMFEKFDSLNN